MDIIPRVKGFRVDYFNVNGLLYNITIAKVNIVFRLENTRARDFPRSFGEDHPWVTLPKDSSYQARRSKAFHLFFP